MAFLLLEELELVEVGLEALFHNELLLDINIVVAISLAVDQLAQVRCLRANELFELIDGHI